MPLAQAPSTVMMVRPDSFDYNPETAVTNAFQQAPETNPLQEIRSQAFIEYNGLVSALKATGVEVIEFTSSEGDSSPDAVFPNNWVSFHPNGKVILYPMQAPSRRRERRLEFITELEKKHAFKITEIVDLSHYEEQEVFLEGTGSLVIDYRNRVVYSNHSPRTYEVLVREVAELLGLRACLFHAVDDQGQDIYHTNVMMCIGEHFTVICLEAIEDAEERQRIVRELEDTGHELISISRHQMNQFAGNMMELRNASGESLLVMSQSAFESLEEHQVKQLQRYSRLVYSPVATIEKYGGGSVRCMLAGIYLPVGDRA